MIVLLKNLMSHKHLLIQFTKRDVFSRYKGSYLGIIWTIIQPLVMLLIYSFVFSVIFKVKWGNQEGFSNLDFAIIVFSGLIIFQMFSEPMYRSTNILLANTNFVKRVVFPLEILPTSVVLSAIINNLFSLSILIAALVWFQYPIGLYSLLVPIVLAPFILFTLGMSYLITTLGVYFKDLSQGMGIIMNVLFYISPIFYPITAVPEQFRQFMIYNPLSIFVESFRAVLIHNTQPDWFLFALATIFSIITFLIGALVFNAAKETFSDAI